MNLLLAIQVSLSSAKIDIATSGDVGMTRVTLEIRYDGLTPGEANFTIAVPEGSVVTDVNSTGGVNPDLQCTTEAAAARALVQRLRRAATALGATDTNELPIADLVKLPEDIPAPRPGFHPGLSDPSLVEASGDKAFRVSLWPLAPGRTQTVVLTVVHPAKDFPLQITGLGRLPSPKTTRNPKATFDAAWASACLAARDDLKRALELKIAGKKSSIILSDTRLHRDSGIKAPPAKADDRPTH